MGFAKSYLISITNIFSIVDWNWPVVKYNLAWYLFFGFTVVSTDPVGPAVLRPRVRLRRAHANARCGDSAALARRGAALDREARRADQVRTAVRRDRVLRGHARRADLPVRRAVLDVRPVRHAGAVDAAGGAADCDRVRAQPLLPVPLSGRRHPGPDVVPHGVPHQALVGVQHLPDLREGLRVGRHRGSEDPDDRVRALRRLRAALCRHQRCARTGASSTTTIARSQSCRSSPCSRIPRNVYPGPFEAAHFSDHADHDRPGRRSARRLVHQHL